MARKKNAKRTTQAAAAKKTVGIANNAGKFWIGNFPEWSKFESIMIYSNRKQIIIIIPVCVSFFLCWAETRTYKHTLVRNDKAAKGRREKINNTWKNRRMKNKKKHAQRFHRQHQNGWRNTRHISRAPLEHNISTVRQWRQNMFAQIETNQHCFGLCVCFFWVRAHCLSC